MKLFRFKNVVTLLIVLLISNFTIAQDGPGDDPDIPTIPLDGGLSILLVAGAAYGGKKVHEYRKRKQDKKQID